MFIAVLFAFLVFVFVLFRGDNIDIYDYISSAFYAIVWGIIVFLLVILLLARSIGIFLPKDYRLMKIISLTEVSQESGKFLIERIEKDKSYIFYYKNTDGKLEGKKLSCKNIFRIYKQYRKDAFAEIYVEDFAKKWHWIFATVRCGEKDMRYNIYLPIEGVITVGD